MCAASNNHSPNKWRMLLHFGRATERGGRSSAPMDGSAVVEREGENVGKTDAESEADKCFA